ncbi:uncharacterized protein LOC126410186 [Nymphaea colorata]|nr:uncharacterized protein LOC126410186 [Nymphaea colorata]
MLPFAILGFVIRPLQLKGFFPSSKSSIMASIQKALVDSKDEGKVDGDASTASYDRSKKKSSLLSIKGYCFLCFNGHINYFCKREEDTCMFPQYVNTKTQKISLLLKKRITTPNWIKHKEL